MSSQFTGSVHSDSGPNPTSLPSRSTSTSIFQAVTKKFSSPKNSVATSFPQPSPTIVVRHEGSSMSFSTPMRNGFQRSFTSLGAHGIFGGKPAEIDDRLNVLQDGFRFMSEHRSQGRSDIGKMQSAAIKLLYKPQRDQSYEPLSPRSLQIPFQQYPFARKSDSVIPRDPPTSRLVFNKLLKSSEFQKHPKGLSSLFTALATIISLDRLRVDQNNPNFNQTSPFFSLSTLYGVDDTETDQIRVKDGRGMLSPDCFFDDRVVLHPRAVSALLILWNRNHNFIAHHLLLNNEGKKWIDPSTAGNNNASISRQDDEIFAIARLINCVHFKNVVAEDFLKVVSGLPSVGPRLNIIKPDVSRQPEAGKDQYSMVEYSLLYSSWSSLWSEKDLKSEGEEDILLGPIPMCPAEPAMNPNRRGRGLAGLERKEDSYFKDEDLARILQEATDHCAGEPGARSVDPSFHSVEERMIELARHWRVCTLNEFRKHLGLKSFLNFEEWNPDPVIARAAQDLYTSIDNLELYIGLHAEQTVPGPGASLGYTLTYALLVDVVTTMRNDPDFTTNLTQGPLTDWGFKDCTTFPQNGADGAWLPNVLQRNLPRYYPYDNVYSLFPLTVPHTVHQYPPRTSTERPKIYPVIHLERKNAISYIFNQPNVFPTLYDADFKAASKGYGYFLGFDEEKLHDKDMMMTMFSLMPDKGALARYAADFRSLAVGLVDAAKASRQPNGTEIPIDIVRDVINAACTRWVCENLCGLPLADIGQASEGAARSTTARERLEKFDVIPLLAMSIRRACETLLRLPQDTLESNEKNVTEMHENFGALSAYIFRNMESEMGWNIRNVALEAAKKLAIDIEKHLPIAPSRRESMTTAQWIGQSTRLKVESIQSYVHRLLKEFGPGGYILPQHSATTFLDRMVKANRTHGLALGKLAQEGHLKELMESQKDMKDFFEREDFLERSRTVANIVGLAVVTSVNYAQACAQAVDFYLDEEYEKEKEDIIRLSTLDPVQALVLSKLEPDQAKRLSSLTRQDAVLEAIRLTTPIPSSSKELDLRHDEVVRLSNLSSAHARKEADQKIMGYIREAQRIGQPLGLWRGVKEDHTIPREHGGPIFVPKDARIFANFNRAHNNRLDVHEPEKVDPYRKTPSIQGIGMHRCPGINFVEETMPELFKVIFSLKNLRRGGGKTGRLQRVSWSPFPSRTEIPFFLDETGQVSRFPKCLSVVYDETPDASGVPEQKIEWKIKPGASKKIEWLRKRVNLGVSVLLVFYLFSMIIWIISSITSLQIPSLSPLQFLPPLPSLPRGRPRPNYEGGECPDPTVFDAWNVRTFVPGLDDNPVPLEYFLKDRKAHKLSIVDIDARDTRMEIHVDGVNKGLTTEIQLDKTVDCGDNLGLCLQQGFSAGVVVVPPGKHTVRIQWVGEDFINDTKRIDWGEKRERRVMWQREYCA